MTMAAVHLGSDDEAVVLDGSCSPMLLSSSPGVEEAVVAGGELVDAVEVGGGGHANKGVDWVGCRFIVLVMGSLSSEYTSA